MEYPEHERLKLVRDKSQAIHEFVHWLGEEKGVHLSEYISNEYATLMMATKTLTNLVAEFFDIDLKQLEKEKLAMIEEMRNGNKNKIQDTKTKSS